MTEQGDPANAIVEHCKASDVDLIVKGRRRLGTLASLAMGSVSNKVAHAADSACMIVS
jgi:nucleotide-binding universal stress UspA family protein